jgi:hypothetical protein
LQFEIIEKSGVCSDEVSSKHDRHEMQEDSGRQECKNKGPNARLMTANTRINKDFRAEATG